MSLPFYEDTAFIPFRKVFPKGKHVYNQGGHDGNISILISGTLEVSKDGFLVGDVTEPGSILGEMALILNSPHTTTVATTTEAELIVIPRAEVNLITKKIPEFPTMLMRTLARRLEKANRRIADLENSYDQLYNKMNSGSVMDTDETGLFNSATIVMDRPAEIIETMFNRKPEDPKQDDATKEIEPAVSLPESLPEGKQPLFVRNVFCPAHDCKEAFPLFFLKKGAQVFGRDEFGITVYERGQNGYAPIDYTLQEVHVCPECCFATNSPENFLPGANRSKTTGFFTIRKSVKEMLAFGLDVRKALVATLPDQELLFSHERGVREAMVSYELALMTARTFYESDRAMFSSWGFRLIIYNLKLAQIQRRYRTVDTEKIYLGRAYDIVKQNIGSFSGAQFLYTYFLAVALAKRLESEKKARDYLLEFNTIRKSSSGLIDSHLGMLCDEYFAKAALVLEGES
ncbi:MAG: Crp/Fnr family transcriptional regulator [Planctomycetes bacterium]|nr:Crp/Fnr family transcriptional regulator [Planctomycetota bacterium]